MPRTYDTDPMEPRNVIVFGANGFLGSHMVDQLLRWGHRVTAFDRFSPEKKNCPAASGNLRRVAGDYRDPETVRPALQGMEVAYNFISAYTPITSWDSPRDSILQDVLPALQLFDQCVEQGLAKIVYVSSGGTIYGPRPGLIDEAALPAPFNPHGICKLTVEYFLNYYRTRSGVATDAYRVGNVFGPRQPLHSAQGVIAVWMKHILDGKPLDVFGDDTTLRDYLFVQDATFLMGHSLRDVAASGTYNLGTGKGVSIVDLLNIFKEVIDMPFECRLHPRRASDNTSAVLSSARLLEHYPDFAFQDLKAMIRHTWMYVKGTTNRPQRP
ncbi:MAG: NAD-dependent epimerase/dehydratase family protein [Desulfovibrionaceae bacterium]